MLAGNERGMYGESICYLYVIYTLSLSYLYGEMTQ